MSHIDAGPLAGYNSLLDPHLAGYFSNIRMRKHLVKSGLITRKGNIVSENTYRLNMARKEHKKHVRDLLAQAIVHKTLDMERTRQVAIKQKLEEIAKVEMVRRVKGQPSLWSEMMATLPSQRRSKPCRRNNTTQTRQESCGRHGDEDILPYLRPPHKKGSRPSSVPSGGSGRKGHEEARPVSAPSKSHQKRSRSSGEHRGQPRIVVDDKGMPHSAQTRSYSGSTDSESRSHSARSRSKGASRYPTEELDDRHLYSLNSQSLRDYTMARYDMDSSRGPSPYRLPQLPPDMIPTPPPSHTPRSPRRPRHHGRSQSKSTSASRSNKGQLMLHRQEPAMKHQERVQTLCDVNMHYFGKSLSLDYERFDPRDEVMVEQQHCGGNTLIVFREKILPGSDFTFTSRRHRGYPFSLTFYVNGVIDCRLSTCCEYKHQSGARLGGKQGHFGMIGVEGAAPCYKCQLNEANSQKKKKKRRSRRKAKDADEDENVCVPVEEDDKINKDVKVHGIGEDQDRHISKDDSIEIPVEDDQESTKDEYEEDVPLSGNDLPPPITEDSEEAEQGSDFYEEDFEEEDSSSKDGTGEGQRSRSGSEDTRHSSEASQVEDGSRSESSASDDKKEAIQSSRSNNSTDSDSSSTSTLRSRSSSESSSDGDSSYSSRQSSSALSQSGSKLETSKSDEDKRKSEVQSSRSYADRHRSDAEQLSSNEKSSRSDADSSTLDEDRSRSDEENSRTDEVQSDEELFSPKGEGSDYDIDVRYQKPIEVKVLCDEDDQPISKESDKHESVNRESNDSSSDSSTSDEEHVGSSLSSRRKKKLRHHHYHQSEVKDYNYSEDDFDEDDKKSNASSRSSSYSSRSSVSTSPSTSSSSSNFQDNDDVLWNILVYTSKKQFAGTDANVYIILYGDTPAKKDVRSDKITLNDGENNFEKGTRGEFKREAPNFEKLTKIRIGHDNSGAASAWHLDRVVLENTCTGKTFTFHCNNWVSGSEDDTAIERELYPAGSDESKQASKIPKVRWHVKVYTSDIRNAGTDSVVYILLSGETKDGEVKESDKIILDNSQNNFERGQCDEFQIETYDFVKLTKLRIGHHNNGLGPAWHLDKIILENAASGKSYTFYCKKWLADNKDDQAIERELFPAGSEEARKSDMARKAIWNVKVYTSDIRNAGTDSDVYILLSGETKDGEVKESDKIILDNSQNNFERGQCDEFQIETYDFVKLTKLRIGHNNNGLGAAWHLDKVEVRNVSTGDLYTFSCNKWLADDKDDCAVERALLPDSQQDSAEQQHQQQSDGEKHDVSDDGSSSLSSSSASASSASASSASSSRSSLAEDQHMVVAQTANVDGTSAELDKESVKDEKSVKVHEDDRQRSSDTESCSSVSDKSSDEVDSDSHKDDQESDKEEKQSIRADNEADGDNKQSIREVEESDKEDKELFTDDKESDKSDKESTRDDEVPDKESATDDKGSDEEYRESARGDKGYDKEDKESTSDDKGPEKENKSSVKDDKGSEEEDKESVRGDKGSDKEDEVAAGEDTNSNNKERESVKDEELTRDDKGSDKEDKTSARDHNESEEEDKESVRDDMASDKGGKVSAGEDTSSDKKERESIRDVKESDKGDKDSTRDDKDSDKKDEVSEVKQQNDQQQGDENKDMNEKEEEEFQRTEKERKSPSSSSSTSYTSGSSSSDSGKEEDNSNNKQMTSPREQSNNSVKENDKDATERPPENVNHVLSPCEEVVGSIRPLIEGRNNIELVNKKLSEDQFKELCDVIKETGEIQALTLRNLNINYRVLEKLTDALLSTKSDDLEMLNLNLNNITPVGASYLAEIVKKKPKLQILLLQNTALGDEGINVLVNALLEVNNKQTEAIYEAAKGMVSSIIASAVETEPAAESVNSDVTSGGGSSENERLVSALEGDQRHGDLRLEQLDVADCQIEDRGIKSLARLVSANTKLDHLCLTGNQKISPAAWRELGEALHSNTNLRECSLDYTDLRDEGVDAFLDGAVGNRGLQSLDLEGNRIGDAGGRMILDFIHNHPNLKEVNLAPGNHIDKTIMDQIQDILDQRN